MAKSTRQHEANETSPMHPAEEPRQQTNHDATYQAQQNGPSQPRAPRIEVSEEVLQKLGECGATRPLSV